MTKIIREWRLRFMTFLKWVWTFPQSFLGLIILLITGATKNWVRYKSHWYRFYIAKRFRGTWGVSLGEFVIFGSVPQFTSNCHEIGHQKQSLILGWFYLLIIGVPSFCGNVFDRLFHRRWPMLKRIDWYYSQPWEHWADVLGGVIRAK